jgi:ACS family D-galactonate transporter-like MFS transporter
MGKMKSKTAPANARPTRARFVVLAWLCAAAALAYVSRNAIAVAESTVRADLGLTKQQSGWLMSAFFFSYALCQIPMAQFGQRAGSRRALSLFAIVWSVATAVTAFVSGLAGFMAARIVQGIAQAGLFPTATVTVAKWFPKTGSAFATGSLGSFMSVGGALCAWLTGVLLEALEPRVAPGWNWRLTFLLFGVPGLVWAAWFWKWFRDEPGEHRSVNEAELSCITDGRSTNLADAHGTRRLATPWLALFSSPALWWICGQQMCRAAGYMFFTSWFATYLQETRGVSIAHSGFLNMLPLLAVVIGGMLGGAMSDWLLERTGSRDVARRWMGTACLLACAALIFWALMLKDALAAVLVISAGSFFSALAAPCAYTLTIDMGGPHVATVNATMNMMGNLGAWAFPIAVPWLLARFGSWDAVLVVFGALYVVGAGFWLLLKPEGTVFEQALINRAAADVDERT